MRSSPELVVLSGRLRIAFDRREDRWGHRLEWRTKEGCFFPLLESVEGTPSDEALPSPPMQEISMQRLPEGVDVALGVGTAGRNHWSIAFTPGCRADGRPENNSLAFALACRLRDQVPEFRSSYRLVSPAYEMRVEPGAVEVAGPDLRLRVHGEAELMAIDDGFSVVVSPPSSRHPPYTEKWSYGITCEADIQI